MILFSTQSHRPANHRKSRCASRRSLGTIWISTPILAREIRSASCWKKRSTPTARRRAMERFLLRSTITGKKYQAILFHDEFGHAAYYNADGKSLQKAFLRSPLKFSAPVTSHFSSARYHPILKTIRPHMGTDYGAPTGTPVQAIGSGRVLFAGLKGGEGNMVHISHSEGYETMYLHLSKMYVRAGEHVEIGKTIGLVGSTGLSTGPHLDFRI